MKIVLTGGGTMGPVTPLLAVVEAWRGRDASVEFLWVGTPHGPERSVVEQESIPFVSIPVARFPRYVSIEWLTVSFAFIAGCIQSFRFLRMHRPDAVASAGGFTSVPVFLAAWLLGIPTWLHQQDVKPILTSRVLAPFATQITVAFEQSLAAFPTQKTRLLGNPVRRSLVAGSIDQAMSLFHLDRQKPTLLVLGGGTGAAWMNRAIDELLPTLIKTMNVIHVRGKGKTNPEHTQIVGYTQKEFLYRELKHAYKAADLVVSRAGMGTITELSALSKAAILIPLPHSAQEYNVQPFHEAIIVVHQQDGARGLLQQVQTLMQSSKRRQRLGEALQKTMRTDVDEEMVDVLQDLIHRRDL